MRNLIFLPFLLFLVTSLNLNAQQCSIRLTFKDTLTSKSISDVHVYHKNILLGSSDENGKIHFIIQCSSSIKLKIVHIAYVQKLIQINPLLTDSINVDLETNPYYLNTAEIRPFQNVDTILGENQFFVEDYLFYNDQILSLLKHRKKPKYMLRLTHLNGVMIDEIPLQGTPLNLDKNAFNTNFLVYENQAFRIKVIEQRLVLTTYGYKDYIETVHHLNFISNQAMLSNNKKFEKPWFEYIFTDRTINHDDTILYVKNSKLYQQYYSEFKFLSARERHKCRVIAYETGLDKYDIAANFTGFSNNIWYKPAQATHINYQNIHYIYNFCNDTLYIFNEKGDNIEKHKINFNKKEGFTGKISLDERTGYIYALYTKNGKLHLNKIIKGELDSNHEIYTIAMRYPKQIKIIDNKVWYLGKPLESYQSTYLYSEKLN